MRDADGERLKSILDAFSGARAGRLHPPTIPPEVLELGIADRPLLPKIVLVQQQHEWQGTQIRFDAPTQRKRNLEGRGRVPSATSTYPAEPRR